MVALDNLEALSKELLPCPLCNSKALLKQTETKQLVIVCTSCKLSLPSKQNLKNPNEVEIAIEARKLVSQWNKRN